MVLLASSNHDLQCALGQFAADCEVVEMRISISSSEAMVLCRNMVDCSLQVGSGSLLQVQVLYLRVLFTSEDKARADYKILAYLRQIS